MNFNLSPTPLPPCPRSSPAHARFLPPLQSTPPAPPRFSQGEKAEKADIDAAIAKLKEMKIALDTEVKKLQAGPCTRCLFSAQLQLHLSNLSSFEL